MTLHPCDSQNADDTCRHKPSIQGHDAGEIEAKRAERLADVRREAPRHLATFRRAYAGKSLRAAVNAFCCECQGFDAAAVRDCTAPACPLFLYRPGRGKGS